jgi:cephalosporin hydroxylase
MLQSIKRKLKNRIRQGSLRCVEVPANMGYAKASVNEVFNKVMALNPRVTSFVEHITLFNLAGITTANIIEIGSYLCYSSAIMASAFQDNTRKLYSIDLFDRDCGWSNGKTDDWIFRDYSQREFAEKFIADCGVADRVELRQGPSHAFAQKFARMDPVDMVFVDGNHSYEGCGADLADYAPCIRSGGYLATHDYNCSQHPGVRAAVDEFLDSNVNFEPLYLVHSMLVMRRR